MDAMQGNRLQLRGVDVAAGDATVVRGVDLDVAPGELHVLLGPNGSGKSSLLSAIMGLPPFRVTQGAIHYRGRHIDPLAVDWTLIEPGAMPRIRQRPGAGNALGDVKFMFPNQHAIYLHDTPSRGLFSRDRRAFSHGCVRVQDPWAFAEALLTEEPGWDRARLYSLRGGTERNVVLDNRVPVHLTYFTARVTDAGELIMAGDLYGHQQRTVDALGL